MPSPPPSPDLPEMKDNKYSIKVRVNKQTDERVSVFHWGIREMYLQYIKIYENLVYKKDLQVLYDRYEKEELLALEDIEILGDKPDAEGDDA